jgi:hypothetical protein
MWLDRGKSGSAARSTGGTAAEAESAETAHGTLETA